MIKAIVKTTVVLLIGLVPVGQAWVGSFPPGLESYGDSVLQPVPSTPPTASVRQELEAYVSEMISYGHMAPALYYNGLGGGGTNLGWPAVFYATPSETIYTLSAAYPYLSKPLQAQVKTYLDGELQAYPLHAQGYYEPSAGTVADLQGTRREYFAPNPEQWFNFWPGVPVHVSVLYTLWLYSYNTKSWQYVTSNYSALRSIYRDFKNSSDIDSYPELSGVIGFARIAQHLGRNADYVDATNFAQAGFARGDDFAQFLATSFANHPAGEHSYTTPLFMVNRNPVVLHFNRDIGGFLNEHAQTEVAAYVQQVSQDVPLWWLTAAALSHGENAFATPEISWTNFVLHAYVLDTSVEKLKRYLDAPDRKGDLLYIQKLVAVLEAIGPPDLSASTVSASSPAPRLGQQFTYTVVVHNSGEPLTNTVHLTNTVPSGLSYVPGTLSATHGSYDDSAAPTLYWSGLLSDTFEATIAYAVTVNEADIRLIRNNVTASARPTLDPLTFGTNVIANGIPAYLPLLIRLW